QIEVPVTIVVRGAGAERVAGGWDGDPARSGHVGERAVPLVVEDVYRRAVDAADEEIEMAVAVEVGEERPRALTQDGDAGRLPDPLEGPIAGVVEEELRPDVAPDAVRVDPAVAVVVARGPAPGHLDGLAPGGGWQRRMLVGEPRLGSHVGEVPCGLARGS